MTDVLAEGGHLDTDTHTGGGHVRMKVEIGWCVRRVRNTNRPATGRGQEEVLPQPIEGTNPPNTPILGFQASELGDNRFLWFKPPPVHGISTAAWAG